MQMQNPALTDERSSDTFEISNMYHLMFQLHASLLKALSHPKRLEITHLLRDHELSVTQIQEMLGLPQANLSQHLTVLRNAHVVKIRKDGKHMYYALAHKNFIKASDLLRDILIERYKDKPLADEFATSMSDLVPLIKDPVCSMRLSPKTAGYAIKYRDQQIYFCAEGCLKKFRKQPKKYIDEN